MACSVLNDLESPIPPPAVSSVVSSGRLNNRGPVRFAVYLKMMLLIIRHVIQLKFSCGQEDPLFNLFIKSHKSLFSLSNFLCKTLFRGA